MSDNSELWDAMHEIRDRVTRIEERSVNRDEKITGMSKQVNDMHTFFLQSQGGIKTATAMTRFAYGIGGLIFGAVMYNWQAIKRLFAG